MNPFERIDKVLVNMGCDPIPKGMQTHEWLYLMAIRFDHINKYADLYDQVDALLTLAKRIRGKAVDDGDYWEISDDVFQEVQKAFDEIKTASANEHD